MRRCRPCQQMDGAHRFFGASFNTLESAVSDSPVLQPIRIKRRSGPYPIGHVEASFEKPSGLLPTRQAGSQRERQKNRCKHSRSPTGFQISCRNKFRIVNDELRGSIHSAPMPQFDARLIRSIHPRVTAHSRRTLQCTSSSNTPHNPKVLDESILESKQVAKNKPPQSRLCFADTGGGIYLLVCHAAMKRRSSGKTGRRR